MNVRNKLAEIGLKPGKGQNFLDNESIVEALVEAGELEEHATLEIGGGLGKITGKILEKTGELTVVEKDPALAAYLRENFPNAEIIEEDVLNCDLERYERCISNIPFQYSSEIILKLGRNQIQSALIVQDELADKIVLDPGDSDYGYFTAAVNYYFIPVKLTSVDSRNFYPEPDVNAAILKLYPNKERHQIENEEEFLEFLKAIYTHKAKKLRNALTDARNMLNIEKDSIKKVRDEAPYSEKRVFQLNLKESSEVFEWFQSEF